MVPSAPEEKTHGCVGWKATSRTPRSRVRVCPLSTLTGTSNGFCNRSLWERGTQHPVGWSRGKGWGRASTHLYTMPWHTITLPSSEPEAKRGYLGWKATARRAFLWCLWTASVFIEGSRRSPSTYLTQPILPQHFVWLGGKIQVKPHQFAVIAATDDVVT